MTLMQPKKAPSSGPVTPEAGRCYRSEDGECVEVVTTATLRITNDLNRPRYVIIRHRNRRWSVDGSDFAITYKEWHERKFAPISRKEFNGSGHVSTHRWAIVPLTKKLAESRDIGVVKVFDYDITYLEGDPGCFKNRRPEVSVSIGKHTVKREPLDGQIHDYRDDARQAKKDYCREHKIAWTTARDYWDYDEAW